MEKEYMQIRQTPFFSDKKKKSGVDSCLLSPLKSVRKYSGGLKSMQMVDMCEDLVCCSLRLKPYTIVLLEN